MHLCSPECSFCAGPPETTLHVLRDCPRAMAIWIHLVNVEYRDDFFNQDLHQWILHNLQRNFGIVSSVDWSSVWATTCHSLWTWRNKETFDSTFSRPRDPWRVVMRSCCDYKEASRAYSVLNSRSLSTIHIRWLPPEQGWTRLNSDGAVKGVHKVAGSGGVLRDDVGRWICGYARALGTCSAYIAELWGVLDGLLIARDRGFSKIDVQVDSMIVMNQLSNSGPVSVSGAALVNRIRALLSLYWEVRFSHCYREANSCADAMASIGCNQEVILCLYEFPPAIVSPLWLADFIGVSTPRVISV